MIVVAAVNTNISIVNFVFFSASACVNIQQQ